MKDTGGVLPGPVCILASRVRKCVRVRIYRRRQNQYDVRVVLVRNVTWLLTGVYLGRGVYLSAIVNPLPASAKNAWPC